MFERFTDRARRVVVLAQEESRLLNHNYIGTEHLLLGLVHEGEGVAAKALDRLGISLEAARARVQEIIGHGPSPPSGHIPFTPRAKKVLELALREALQLGHNYIGTEHILLGLIREGEGVAAQVLIMLGADLSRVRQEVIQVLSGYAPPPTRPAIPSVETPATVRAKQEARRLAGTRPVGTHHILQAILRDPDSVGAKALAALGVTAEALEARLADLDTAQTSDELPEEVGARHLTVELVGDRVAVLLDDPDLQNRLAEHLREPKAVRSGDPAGAPFPQLWRDVTRHLEHVVRRLEGEAARDWRPPEWAEGWNVAAYAVVHTPVGMETHFDVAGGFDPDDVRSRLAEWLTAHQPSDAGPMTYVTVLVNGEDDGTRTYRLFSGRRPDWPHSRLDLLVTRALVDLGGSRPET